MVKIYGIKNCDIMQKAFKWLDAQNIKYDFHNYKEQGIDVPTLKTWLQHIPINQLINIRSTTYRELTDAEKAGISDPGKAIELILKNASIVKRPLWDFGNGKFFLGWDEKELSKILL